MAAKKKTAKKKSKKKARKKITRKKLLDTIDKELADLSKGLEKRLAPLRKEIEKAERQASTTGARMLRKARTQLNQVDLKGHSDWTKFLRGSRRELSKALTELEKSVRPRRKKKTARKKKAAR